MGVTAIFPDPWLNEKYSNPILVFLVNGIREHHWDAIPTSGMAGQPDTKWMIENHNRCQVIHMHWPEMLYKSGRWNFRGFTRFIRCLLQIRYYNIGLVWTLHDLYPHPEKKYYLKWYHRFARLILCRAADMITVCGSSAVSIVQNEFNIPNEKLAVVELGNYIGYFPEIMSREQARQTLGVLPDETVYLVFGSIRYNRNPAYVISAFQEMKAPKAKLFIVGSCPEEIASMLSQAAMGDERIIIKPTRVEDSDVDMYLKASDVVVMSGHQLTSSVVLVGLSYGKCVIAPNYATSIDMLKENAGILFSEDDPHGLANAMQQALKENPASYYQKAIERANELTWDKSGKAMVEVYEKVLSKRKISIDNLRNSRQRNQIGFFDTLRPPKQVGWPPISEEYILARLNFEAITFNFQIHPLRIDLEDYQRYIKSAKYEKRYPTLHDLLPEKGLEHYLAAKLLEISSSDIYVDVAGTGNPVPDIYHNLYGATTISLNTVNAAGENEISVSQEAYELNIPNSYASAIGLHCALEHFEGTSDINLLNEAKRILKPGGRLCIVPLYLANEYSILTDPKISSNGSVDFGKEATIYSKEGWGERHGRFYDPNHLISRVFNTLTGMDIKIYHVVNASEIHPSCYVKFVLLAQKPIDQSIDRNHWNNNLPL